MNEEAIIYSCQHLIIAGVNKCGTTSVFRYLSDHPNISPSPVKELRYFLDYVTSVESQNYHDYKRQFQLPGSGCNVALEASPIYFTAGRDLARRIHAIVPEARFIVLLREPAERLHSYFRSAKSYDNYATRLLEGYDFAQFVRQAIEAARNREDDRPGPVEFRRALDQGCYASHAARFHSVVPAERTRYVFFEELKTEPHKVMVELCEFIGISPKVYESYDFTVENKSRSYRVGWLQRAAFRVNMSSEAYLNRVPRLRHFLRSAYLFLNERKAGEDISGSQAALQKLKEYYRNENIQLMAMLQSEYPGIKLPSWLQETAILASDDRT